MNLKKSGGLEGLSTVLLRWLVLLLAHTMQHRPNTHNWKSDFNIHKIFTFKPYLTGLWTYAQKSKRILPHHINSYQNQYSILSDYQQDFRAENGATPTSSKTTTGKTLMTLWYWTLQKQLMWYKITNDYTR